MKEKKVNFICAACGYLNTTTMLLPCEWKECLHCGANILVLPKRVVERRYHNGELHKGVHKKDGQ